MYTMRSEDKVTDNVPKQVLAFCFVKVLPKVADDIHTIQEAVRLYEENDQLHFQISEKIREKVFDRERLLSKLNDLKNYYLYRHNQRTAWKVDMLNLLHLALENFSVANKPHLAELDDKKMNYMMLHGSRKLSEERKLLRNKNMCHKTDDTSSSPLLGIMKNVQMKYSIYNYYKQNICDKLLKEIKLFEQTRKRSAQLKEGIKNQVKIMSDELMEMRKKKQALETKIKHVDKQIEVINEEIWSFQKHLKDCNCRKDASLLILQGMKSEEYWVLRHSNLEYESIYTHTIYLDKCTPQERRRRNKQLLHTFV